jgi:hypothetical protein
MTSEAEVCRDLFLKLKEKADKHYYLAMALTTRLCTPGCLWCLNLGHLNLDDDDVAVIVDALLINDTVEDLDLGTNFLGFKSASELKKLLEKTRSLAELRIGNDSRFRQRGIGSEGAEALAEALKRNKTLRRLELYNNRIDHKGVKALAEAIKENSVIEFIDFKLNLFESEGAAALGGALAVNTSLTHIDIEACNIMASGAKAIASGLQFNTNLLILKMKSNAITPKGAFAIANVLENYNRTLQELHLRDNLEPDMKLYLERPQPRFQGRAELDAALCSLGERPSWKEMPGTQQQHRCRLPSHGVWCWRQHFNDTVVNWYSCTGRFLCQGRDGRDAEALEMELGRALRCLRAKNLVTRLEKALVKNRAGIKIVTLAAFSPGVQMSRLQCAQMSGQVFELEVNSDMTIADLHGEIGKQIDDQHKGHWSLVLENGTLLDSTSGSPLRELSFASTATAPAASAPVT